MTGNDDKNQPQESFEEALAKFKKNLTSELDNIFDEDAIKARKEGKVPKTHPRTQNLPRLEVANFGVVASFSLPPGWVESSFGQQEQQQGRSRIFHDSANPTVQLCFFFRGHRVSENAAAEFLSLIAKPDHFLKPSEFKAVLEIVRDLGNPAGFKPLQSATRQLGGKRVLVVEGRFIQSEQDTYALFVDVDGSGTIIQEIHYQAPKLDYARHLLSIKSAFDSISWRTPQ